jgi:hypothetical protein
MWRFVPGGPRRREDESVRGTIDFVHDASDDLVIATPRWTISTREDCEFWYQQWVSYLSKFGRKVDCIMVLDDFHVDGAIASTWGEYRARINNEHIRYSYRVNSDWMVRTFVLTSGLRYNAATGEAESVEAAIEGIKARRAEALGDRPAEPRSSKEPG